MKGEEEKEKDDWQRQLWGGGREQRNGEHPRDESVHYELRGGVWRTRRHGRRGLLDHDTIRYIRYQADDLQISATL